MTTSSTRPPSAPNEADRSAASGFSRRTFLAAAGVGASVPLLSSEQARATVRAVSPEAAAASTKIVVRLKEGTNLSATPGPDGSMFLDLQGVVWRMPAQGGQARPITDATLEPARPDWSPKAGLLAFQAFETGNYHVYVCRPDGSGLERLTDGPFDDREMAWSPDGRRIAFASDRAEEGSYDIWTIDADGANLERQTPGKANDYAPTWAADGRSLVFVRDRTTLARVAVGGEGAVETVRTAPEGSRVERPSLSPEGRLAYLVFADAGGTDEVHVDGRRVSEPGEDVFIAPPRWLETDRLLYTADGVVRVRDLRSGAKRVIPFTAIFEIEREAYTLKVVDPARPGPSTAVGLVTPRISPDGRALAFIALNRIWLRRPTGIRSNSSIQAARTPSAACPGRATDARCCTPATARACSRSTATTCALVATRGSPSSPVRSSTLRSRPTARSSRSRTSATPSAFSTWPRVSTASSPIPSPGGSGSDRRAGRPTAGSSPTTTAAPSTPGSVRATTRSR